MSKIGFVGIGNMGLPMAANLLKAGHTIKVFDVNAQQVALLTAQGALACDSVAQVCQDIDFFISMLPADSFVSSVYCEPQGVFACAAKQTILLECSTISVAGARQLHDTARAHGFILFDAPVSGGTAGAAAGTLTFMVGGAREQFARVQTILSAMGKNIYYAGGDGAGQATKICNNLMLAMHMLGTCEGMLLGQRLGLDMSLLWEICNHASGQSWSLTHYCPMPDVLPNVPASHNYQPGFMGKMMLKDLKLATAAAEAAGMQLPMLQAAVKLYQAYCDAGNSELDFSGIIQALTRNT